MKQSPETAGPDWAKLGRRLTVVLALVVADFGVEALTIVNGSRCG